jgi:hypothetical protein
LELRNEIRRKKYEFDKATQKGNEANNYPDYAVLDNSNGLTEKKIDSLITKDDVPFPTNSSSEYDAKSNKLLNDKFDKIDTTKND